LARCRRFFFFFGVANRLQLETFDAQVMQRGALNWLLKLLTLAIAREAA